MYQEYEPINILKPFAEDIWIVDGPVIKWNGFPFPTRMTVLRLKNNDIWLHSPTPFLEDLKMEIEKLGQIRHLVSPNKIHNVFIRDWSLHLPNALKWAPPGLMKKMPEIRFDYELRDMPEGNWFDEINQVIFKGSPFMEEVVFFHKQSKTLILADLIENYEEERIHKNFHKILAKIGGVMAPEGKTPIDWRFSFYWHKKQAKAVFIKMLDWQPEKIIISHGKCFVANGTQELKRAFDWLLD